MNESAFNSSIVKSAQLCARIGLEPVVTCPSSLKVCDAFNAVALSATATHESIYFSGLENKQYNFLLPDYSYFQFSYTPILSKPHLEHCFELRMAYYPNPINSNDELMPESPDNQLMVYNQLFMENEWSFEEYSQALCELKANVTVPIIRYDMSEDQYRRLNHPKAHIHLGVNNSSRLATNKIFTPELFTVFVLSNFHRAYWEACSGSDFEMEQFYAESKNNCPNVSDDHFCDLQSRLLNIS
ncbi:DUF2290 domain-containing protein [Vibrio mediterranei]|uniref:DUF2290 domain-containing protein n=1 Tax=Vibrio mediterranei TaxID=689 RepID=UPI001EFCEA24|nr:DUF2290 domain-containing protein [Vibrio mediterranei]MCG9665816.1 DUF2290 domain-containing protein [Vibrio mediterranei]